MNIRKIILATTLLSLPVYGFTQCDFKSEKKQPEYTYIKTSVGPSLLQWKFWIGKSTTGSDFYLWVHVVESGNHKYNMNSNDKITFEFEDGSQLAFAPDGEAKAKIFFDGSIVTATYPVRLKVDRNMMEKLHTVALKNVSAAIKDRKEQRNVKDNNVKDIKAAAGCVLN